MNSNPSTLTVKVPEGITREKYKQALEAALWGEGSTAGFTSPRPPDCDIYITANDYSTSKPKPIPIALRTDALDPEDTDLCCRVLGAVVRIDKGFSMYFKWHDGHLCACTKDGVLLGTKGMPTAVREGFELHSIPSLGLTR